MNLFPMRPLPAFCLLAAAGLTLSSAAHAAGPSPKPAVSPAPAVAPKPEAENDSADADTGPLPTPDPAAVKEIAGFKSADQLWDYLKKYAKPEAIEPDPSKSQEQQMAQARAMIAAKISHLQPALDAFLKQYPDDPRRWDAKLLRLYFLSDVEKIDGKEAETTLHEIAAAKDASPDARQQARAELLEAAEQEADPSKGLTDDLEKEFSLYEKDFPDDENGGRLVTLRLRFLGNAGQDKILAELNTLAKSPNKSTAAAAKDQLALRTQPLELKFTATDGKEIDVEKYRGKVVLLDFWATWCAPCMAKLPEVLAVKKKYGAKDFQIVGISLDEDKGVLAKVTKQKGMDWPEACDEKSFQGTIPGKFGVELIPTAWLLDRKGIAHPLSLDADLDAEIGKLVAEK